VIHAQHALLRWLASCLAAGLLVALSGAIAVGVSEASPKVVVTGAPTTHTSHVSLALTDKVVKPRQVTTLTAQVHPLTPGRTVILRLFTSGRFRNLRIARTNEAGVATFRHSFSALGTMVLRATVLPTATLSAATTKSKLVKVDAELPFLLTPAPSLGLGATGPEVLLLQQRLTALGYWLGAPSGNFDDATQQAVYALEKVSGLPRTGIVDAPFAAALNAGDVPKPRTTSGNAIEVNLELDLVVFVKNGALEYVINCSSGGGYTYTENGETDTAVTPTGVYSIVRVVDGTVTDSLGTLWRPRFFYEGFAIHGDSYVPPEPVSHGCVRVSNEAIDWIWAENLAPIGIEVWLY
jgi:peptidoglycan hydrolase-like protein with peptidoglycan-binding domain